MHCWAGMMLTRCCGIFEGMEGDVKKKYCTAINNKTAAKNFLQQFFYSLWTYIEM